MAEYTSNRFTHGSFNNGQEISNKTILGKGDIMSLASGLLWVTEEHERLSERLSSAEEAIETVNGRFEVKVDEYDTRISEVEGFAEHNNAKLYADIEPRVSANEANIENLAEELQRIDNDINNEYSGLNQRLALAEMNIDYFGEAIYSDLSPRLDALQVETTWLKNVVQDNFVTMNTYTDTFVTRKTETPDGKVIISNVDTKVLSVKGETVNQDGTLTNAIFNGITSVSADESNASALTMPTPVTLGMADTLNVTEGKVYRYTSNAINAWECSIGRFVTGGVVWVQFYVGTVPFGNAVKANCEMQSKYIDQTYVASLGGNATISMCNKTHPNDYVRMIVGTVAEITGNSEATTATEDEIRAYLQENNVVFVYQKTNAITEEVACPTAYIAYNGGTETVEGNGIPVTVTQKFLVKV